MGAKTLLSLEQFEALPEDGHKYELNQGELVVMPLAKRCTRELSSASTAAFPCTSVESAKSLAKPDPY